jgi:hypothetical protein
LKSGTTQSIDTVFGSYVTVTVLNSPGGMQQLALYRYVPEASPDLIVTSAPFGSVIGEGKLNGQGYF